MQIRTYLLDQLRDLDWTLLLLAILLALSGLTAIYSIEVQHGTSAGYFARQSMWTVLGIALFFTAFYTSRKVIHNFAYIAYAVGILLLLIPITINRGGAVTRWIMIGNYGFQPSEFMKILLVIGLAKYFGDHKRKLSTFKELMTPLAMTLVPMFLVLIQPDLGTALVYFAILSTIIFWAGIRPLYFFLLLAPAISMLAAFQTLTFFLWMGLILVVLYFGNQPFWTKVLNFGINIFLGGITNVLWGVLKPYQQQRILSLFNSDLDPLGAGYQVSQSLTALGAGGPYGKGFGEGTQTHLKFLPEQHTDFIMTVIGEEFGFIGVSIVLVLFYFLLAKLITLAYSVKFRFDSVILIGVAAILVFHIFINLGMIVGIMPVTGIPLPFISYGGSFMLTCMILVGLAANMAIIRRAV
ncbi:MAG: rod shape-determining protein RodA [Candidatus Marinimicrobia bacterium]|nr:rod shape-determining protein RodA [Candidatus Neomarinimicrobiota bacterium]